MQRYRDPDPPGAVERAVLTILAIIATVIVTAFIALLVAIWFLIAPSSRAMADELYRVPSICKPLAEKYGIPDRVSAEEARRIVGELDRHSWWPGVKQCRKAVKLEWKL